jgi:leucine dehydrogenase
VKVFEPELSLEFADYERVAFCSDEAAGYRGIVVIHNTTLGPSIGGIRFWQYESDEAALTDALRLARGMTYKNAVADLPFGGGKSIIIGDNKTEMREPIFRAHGRFIETFKGKYIAGEDVGTSPSDIEYVRMETSHVGGVLDKSGDPSPHTAHGVFRATQAASKYLRGTDDLSGKTVALQGCGHVGFYLARELHNAGANLVVTDIYPESVKRVVEETGARFVEPESIYETEADIFAPCALGGILNEQTIPKLKAEIIVGAANNQLLEDWHCDLLAARNILYAPDYVVNAGGVINGSCRELLDWDEGKTAEKINAIYETTLAVFNLASDEKLTTAKAADKMAEQRLRHN